MAQVRSRVAGVTGDRDGGRGAWGSTAAHTGTLNVGPARKRASVWRQMRVLFARQMQIGSRDLTLYYLQFGIQSIYGFLVGVSQRAADPTTTLAAAACPSTGPQDGQASVYPRSCLPIPRDAGAMNACCRSSHDRHHGA